MTTEDSAVVQAVYLGHISEQVDTVVIHLQTFLQIFGIAVSLILAIWFIKKYIIGMFSSWGGKFRL